MRFVLSRSAVATLLLAVGALSTPDDVRAQPKAQHKRLHAISLVAPPRMPPDFKHFPWVNPDAPKGGELRLASTIQFDSLNPYSYKGEIAPGSNPKYLLQLVHEPLMVASRDEASTVYGLIAEWISHPDDFSSVTFGLRPEARFHDGQPITPEDVIYSMEAQKKADPQTAYYYQDVLAGEKTGEREVTFRFKRAGNRELPMIVAELNVMPRRYWTGTDAAGKPRDPTITTIEPPTGSGPYRIKSFEIGRFIVYERVKDYWGRDLPARRGQYNFDTIRFLIFSNETAQFEAFKAGETDIHSEINSKRWATEYTFPAAKEGRLLKEALKLNRSGHATVFLPNVRREIFADRRVRRALWLAFDFETFNAQVTYGLYTRVSSVYQDSALAAEGLPTKGELALLEPLKALLPPEVFTTPFKNPVAKSQAEFRAHLKEADRLLNEAGYTVKGSVRMRPGGREPFRFEFLYYDKTQERYILPWQRSLALLSVDLAPRKVDQAAYENRKKAGEFDIISEWVGQSDSPGNEQLDFWSSAAADQVASRNRGGIKDKAIDALIPAIIYAKSRADLIDASRALDRTLMWNHYLIPQWYNPDEWLAYWNRFSRPERVPSQASSFWQVWWRDAAKAAKLGEARK